MSPTKSFFERASDMVEHFVSTEGKAVFVVWYAKQPTFNEDDFPKSKTELIRNFVRLAQVKAKDLGEVFCAMQGESWSPFGGANQIIHEAGLRHTSMSVGDVIQAPNGKFFAVMDIGFKELNL